MKAVSAARTQSIASEHRGPLVKRLRSETENAFLNGLSVLRDLAADFQNRDRFFKYKALIIAIWVGISTVSVILSCPDSSEPKNILGARLVMARVTDTPVAMLVNESGKPWTDVVVVVNRRYRAAVARVSSEAPENNLTLEPKKLLGDNGMPAPQDLEFSSIELRTMQGRATILGDKTNPEK